MQLASSTHHCKHMTCISRLRQPLRVFAIAVSATISLLGLPAVAQEITPTSAEKSTLPESFDFATLHDEVTSLVAEHFYKRDFDTVAWTKRAADSRARALECESHDEFSNELNSLLSSLNSSHTYYYSKLNPKRYQLLGVFNRLFDPSRMDLFVYDGVGIDSIRIEGRYYICGIFDGFSGQKAGLKFGDAILRVDGEEFHPILSFRSKADQQVEIEIIRQGTKQSVTALVQAIDGRNMFEKALQESVQVFEREGKRIGYVHIWSYAGEKYQDALKDAILWGELKDCDSLVLDLRDGWGGADLNYVNLFRAPIAEVTSLPKAGPPGSYSGVWNRPVALLTNSGSTSGKELFTYGFKKLHLGKIVGETTAGAVLAGRIFLLSNGDALYLAVADVIVDGKRLEGVGVKPDIAVQREIVDAAAGDPQLDAALESLTSEP